MFTRLISVNLPRDDTSSLIACLSACTAASAAAYSPRAAAVKTADAARAAISAKVDIVTKAEVSPVRKAIPPREVDDTALSEADEGLSPRGGILPTLEKGCVGVRDDGEVRMTRS